MIVYTSDQIFDLLQSVENPTDLVEVTHYILTYQRHYSVIDQLLFTLALHDLWSILI